MKQCPKCQTSYPDDKLQFCLQDGTRLLTADQELSDSYDTESETVVAPKRAEPIRIEPQRVEPIRFEPPSSYQTNPPIIVEQPREPPKTNTAMIVIMSVLGTTLLLGLGGLGAYLYLGGKKTEVAVNVNSAPANRPANANAAANNQNANANAATPTPTATPTVQPTLEPEKIKAITGDVKDVVDTWKDSTENGDLDQHVSQYADAVDYYKAGRVNVSRVRADRERAFTTYDTMIVNIDNVKVTPDATGEKATVVLDKEWNFEGVEKFSNGKVQQQLTMGKIGGKWKITGEKDLKVYYTSN